MKMSTANQLKMDTKLSIEFHKDEEIQSIMKNQYSILIEYPESAGVTCDNPLWLNAKGSYSDEQSVRKFYEGVVDAGIFKILKVKKLEN